MIEILRLKSGEDIIGEVKLDNGEFEIEHPMYFELEQNRGGNTGLVMQCWLPIQLIENNLAKIKKEDVLTTFSPNKDFQEYYLNTVKKINEVFEAKKLADSMTDEEIDAVMNEMELAAKGNQTIH